MTDRSQLRKVCINTEQQTSRQAGFNRRSGKDLKKRHGAAEVMHMYKSSVILLKRVSKII
eukprot:scaffold289906_cov15-Prasinocladus_malaysianus.AAC.1